MMASALVHLAVDQTQHVELIIMSRCQRRYAANAELLVLLDQCRSRKIDRYRFNPQWTGCGSESVPRSVLTLQSTALKHLRQKKTGKNIIQKNIKDMD